MRNTEGGENDRKSSILYSNCEDGGIDVCYTYRACLLCSSIPLCVIRPGSREVGPIIISAGSLIYKERGGVLSYAVDTSPIGRLMPRNELPLLVCSDENHIVE